MHAHDSGGANGSHATFTIAVTPVNDPPASRRVTNQTVSENAGAQSVSGWATGISEGPSDESGQTVSFQITGNTNAALFSAAPSVSPGGTLSYTPAASKSGTATITLVLKDNGGTANGGDDTSSSQSFMIQVSGVNDPPSFTKGADQTDLEDAGPQSVDPWATAISPGPSDESGQTVTFVINSVTNPTLFASQPSVDADGVLTYTPGCKCDRFLDGRRCTLTITVVGPPTTVRRSRSRSPSPPVNDAPTFTKGANQTVAENAAAQTVNNWATNISEGPSNESSQTVTFAVTNDNTGLFSSQPAVSPTGTLTYSPAPSENGSATVSVQLQDSGGTANGGDDTSAIQTFTITVTGVNDPPSFTKGANQTFLEDSGAHSISGLGDGDQPRAARRGGSDRLVRRGRQCPGSVLERSDGLFVRDPDLHASPERHRHVDGHASRRRQRRNREWGRRQQPAPDVHDHAYPGERSAVVHQGPEPDAT